VLGAFEHLQDPKCNCWQEIPRQYVDSTDENASAPANVVATGWVLLGKATLGSQASPATVGFLTEEQHADGWWGIFELSKKIDVSRFASPYGTGWALLGLQAQRKLLPREVSSQLDVPLQNGRDWLLRKKSSPARWQFYPQADHHSNESEGLSGFVLHVLHMVDDEPKVVGLEDIDREWLHRLPDRCQALDSQEMELTLVNTPMGASNDHFEQIVVPWMIIATVDAYRAGSVLDRARASYWLEKAVTNPALRDAHTRQDYWWRAELLYSLRYLCTHLKRCPADQVLPRLPQSANAPRPSGAHAPSPGAPAGTADSR
jgi:hypothetical protein